MHLLFPNNTMPQEEWLDDEKRKAMIVRFWQMFHDMIGDDAIVTRLELSGTLLTRDLAAPEIEKLMQAFRTEFRRELEHEVENLEKVFVA
ncbi:hypothetical protein A2635_04255 [Candidatus Peribacteria bacterium RIFCSPHIGHO2_01_FULL_51_9]|nr:MAG: hypothetical protein A2635_04255 [Candidatus Peribacteria bacterium RIFCSPHIGHO2_01_FULL_51_9]